MSIIIFAFFVIFLLQIFLLGKWGVFGYEV